MSYLDRRCAAEEAWDAGWELALANKPMDRRYSGEGYLRKAYILGYEASYDKEMYDMEVKRNDDILTIDIPW